MRVVFVQRGLYPERIGGTYTYVYELGRKLAAKGHRVDVIASTRESHHDTVANLEGMTIHRYAFRRLHPVYSTLQHLQRTLSTFRKITARDPVDVLSIHEAQLGHRLTQPPVRARQARRPPRGRLPLSVV